MGQLLLPAAVDGSRIHMSPRFNSVCVCLRRVRLLSGKFPVKDAELPNSRHAAYVAL